ncbi:MAG: hypothetical protein ACRDUY_10085, partial [Nitriliruptorales bacterium]
MRRLPVVLLLVLAACSGPEAPQPADVAEETGPASPTSEETAAGSPSPGPDGADASPESSPAPATSPAGSPPQQASHRMWVAVEGAGELVLVDLDGGGVLERHEVGGGPHNLT